MLNEYAYCPRLFALEWPNQEWADSSDTVEGRAVHRRVDRASATTKLPFSEDDPDRPATVRSLDLGSSELRLVAKIDLVEAGGGEVVPVDYKRGTVPDIPDMAYEPERVQVCAQILLLRANGYARSHGVLYFAGSRQRVRVEPTEDLVATTLRYRDAALEVVETQRLPEPLVDSPKCVRCSLVAICLPDEQNLLTGRADHVRPLMPERDVGLPLYVQRQGGSIGKDHDEIVVRDRDGQVVAKARLNDTSRVVVIGNVTVTTPLLKALAGRDIPVAFHGHGAFHFGTFTPVTGRNVMSRIAQHRAASDPVRSLALARAFVHSKIVNARVLLRRNGRAPDEALLRLQDLAADSERAVTTEGLLGIEGSAAAFYFRYFATMLKPEFGDRFAFDGRNRRPPRDPVNALLSFGYAILVREITIISGGIGLDPYVGFLHQPRFGRASLALDLAEEFRPVLADSAVINTINNGVVQPDDFVERGTGVALTDRARGAFIEVLERRFDEVATHPVFDTRLSYRRILEVQARLLAKVLTGDLATYPEFRIR